MNPISSFLGPAAAILVLAGNVMAAVEFTPNTAIGPFDTNFDGADIVISNCTVTVDGAHTFGNLIIANGGGLIQISAAGDMQIDGTIVANGADAANNRAGGGSSGGIWLSAEALRGSGNITANGGAGAPNHGDGGGGGRIAINSPTNLFAGTINVSGGDGAFPGQPLAEPYIGKFTIGLPTLSGTVTDTNSTPAVGVTLQPDGGLTGAVTDEAGNYSIGVPPGWKGTVTPALGSFMFAPGSRTCTKVTESLSNQDYLMVSTIAPGLTAGLSGTNLVIHWNGFTVVTYQSWWSTNLVDWLVLGDPVPGTNGPMQVIVPLDTVPAAFFRPGASDWSSYGVSLRPITPGFDQPGRGLQMHLPEAPATLQP